MLSIHKIVVCGAGTMGKEIAQIAAQNGFVTMLFDVNKTILDNSRMSIEKNLETLVDKGKIDNGERLKTINNLHFTSNINECVADIIIEAIIEKKETKIELFNELVRYNNSTTIFASNTSSISINAIANAFTKPSQVAGLHFFNPATIMKLVEVIRADQTSNEVIDTLVQFSKRLNKTPVVCNDSPGFIVNRVARPYYLEAMKLIEQNLATIENVDAIMEASGFKMGPFKLMDLIGLDINYNVSQIVWNDLGKPNRLKPSNIQKQKVDTGEMGRKSGKGFYEY